MKTKNGYATGTLIDTITKTNLKGIKIMKESRIYNRDTLNLSINTKQSAEFLKWFGEVIAKNKKQIVRFTAPAQDHGTYQVIDKPIDNFFFIKKFKGYTSSKFNWTIKLELEVAEDNWEIASFYGRRNRQINAKIQAKSQV